MQQVVSITSQGQLTIPRLMLQDLGIYGSTKALIQKKKNVILVTPRNDFWSLAGSLKSEVKLSDSELREARKRFSKTWAKT